MTKTELDELDRLLEKLHERADVLWLHYRRPDEDMEPTFTAGDCHQTFDRIRVLMLVKAQASNLASTLKSHGALLGEP